jgi:hypothetical protein
MQRRRRIVGVLCIAVAIALLVIQHPNVQPTPQTKETPAQAQQSAIEASSPLARAVLDELPVKGRAPKTGYERAQFGDGWLLTGGCDTRNIILGRDLSHPVLGSDCKVSSGVLADPYTGTTIVFSRGKDTSNLVQIDHVVALSNAWQTGAQLLPVARRIELANDPLELLAVDGNANQVKSDGDAATWLPSNKAFRCQYVARQIAVKAKYGLWVTDAEKSAMARILEGCPEQLLPTPS